MYYRRCPAHYNSARSAVCTSLSDGRLAGSLSRHRSIRATAASMTSTAPYGAAPDVAPVTRHGTTSRSIAAAANTDIVPKPSTVAGKPTGRKGIPASARRRCSQVRGGAQVTSTQQNRVSGRDSRLEGQPRRSDGNTRKDNRQHHCACHRTCLNVIDGTTVPTPTQQCRERIASRRPGSHTVVASTAQHSDGAVNMGARRT